MPGPSQIASGPAATIAIAVVAWSFLARYRPPIATSVGDHPRHVRGKVLGTHHRVDASGGLAHLQFNLSETIALRGGRRDRHDCHPAVDLRRHSVDYAVGVGFGLLIFQGISCETCLAEAIWPR